MGKENDVILEYLDVKEHFADLFNGTYFNGERAVDAQGLEDSSSVYWDNFQEEAAVLEVLGETMRSSQQQRTVHSERRRDLKKKLKSGNSLRVLAIEHQASVDMSMAWRHMYYDALEYKKQIKECGEYNEKYGLLKPEQKYQNCKLTEEDRLVPVFTACLYLGEEPWNGPRSLKDMMHFKKGDEQWEKLFADYQMNLICVNEMTDFSNYHTSLKLLLMLLANRSSKKKMKKLIAENPEFCKVDKDTARVAGTLLGVEMAMEKIIEAEGEEVNMCTGLKEWLLEEREEGHKEGHKEGRSVLNVLNIKLAEAGRVDDILKAAMDNEYQDKLLAEYGLMS